MAKRVTIAVIAMAALVVVLAGCSMGGSGSETVAGDTPTGAPTPTPIATLSAVTSTPVPVADFTGEPTPTPVLIGDEPPVDVTWVSPGKVEISNYYPGAKAEYPVTIHNGSVDAVTFTVAYRHPDNVATGYSEPVPETEDWIIVADATPILMPNEKRDVMIILAMPKESGVDKTLTGDKWEFWVSVRDMSQAGTVRTELCVRWLVSMR